MRKTDVQAIVTYIKTTSGCTICGYNSDPTKLDFHHREDTDRKFCIGDFRCSQVGDINKLFDEIDKCIILCRVCHNIWEAGLRRGVL